MLSDCLNLSRHISLDIPMVNIHHGDCFFVIGFAYSLPIIPSIGRGQKVQK